MPTMIENSMSLTQSAISAQQNEITRNTPKVWRKTNRRI